MRLTHRRPASPLDAYVEMLWFCEGLPGPHRRERVLPNGRFQIIFDLSERLAPPIVVGLQTHYGILETASLQLMIGAVLRSPGAHGLFDVPADLFQNQVIPLDVVWGSGVSALRDRLRAAPSVAAKFGVLEQALRWRAAKQLTLHPAVEYAITQFRQSPRQRRVLDVRREAGLSHRRFSELFRQQIGLTPKLYCRVHRFRGVVNQIASGRDIDWATLALESGYADQAHFANEFRDFSGLTPGAYLASDRYHAHHVVID